MHAGRGQTTFSPTAQLNPRSTPGLILTLYISVSFALTKKPRNLPEEEQNKNCVLRLKRVSRLAAQCRVKVDFFFFLTENFPQPSWGNGKERRARRRGRGGSRGSEKHSWKKQLPPE